MEDAQKAFEVIHKILHTVPLEKVMNHPVVTIYQDQDFSVVEELFTKKKIRHMPVVDRNDKIVGVISQKDVYRHIAPRRSPDGEVFFKEGIIRDEDGFYEKDSLNQYILNVVMRKDPFVLSKNHSLGEAIHAMVLHKISCVPIVDDDKHAIGIVTRLDVLKLVDLFYANR